MARVLLVIPFKDASNFMVHQPLGAMYLATALVKARSDEVRICDLRLHHKDPLYLEKQIKEFKPEVAGVSAMAYEADQGQEICKRIKSVNQEIVTIIGGPAVSTLESKLIKEKVIDYTCHGEGELLFPSLIKALDGGDKEPEIPGLGFLSENGPTIFSREIPTVPLEEFGHPAWDLIELERYFEFPRQGQIFARKEYMSIFTSRGCPFRCAYCHNVFGKKFRARSAEHVLEELTILSEKYGIREISVLDDSFNMDSERLLKISELVTQSNLDLAFNFSNGIRADMADEKILSALKKMGTYKLAVAVETASERLQKMIHKNARLDKLEKIIRQADNLGIMTWGFFMLGFPTETENEALTTVKFARKSKLHLASFNIVNPYPGTELFELAGLSMEDEEKVTQSYDFLLTETNASEIPTSQLKIIRRNANILFYLNPMRLYRFFRLLPNKTQIIGAVWSFIRRLTIWS